jgi:hypothetical protein
MNLKRAHTSQKISSTTNRVVKNSQAGIVRLANTYDALAL